MLPELEADVAKRYAEQMKAQGESKYYGPDRVGLLFSPPAHLDGSLPGDAGFDPLGLARDDSAPGARPVPVVSGAEAVSQLMTDRRKQLGFEAEPGTVDCRTKLERLFDAEVVHGRWAQLAVPGCLIPEALQRVLGDKVRTWRQNTGYPSSHTRHCQAQSLSAHVTTSGGRDLKTVHRCPIDGLEGPGVVEDTRHEGWGEVPH